MAHAPMKCPCKLCKGEGKIGPWGDSDRDVSETRPCPACSGEQIAVNELVSTMIDARIERDAALRQVEFERTLRKRAEDAQQAVREIDELLFEYPGGEPPGSLTERIAAAIKAAFDRGCAYRASGSYHELSTDLLAIEARVIAPPSFVVKNKDGDCYWKVDFWTPKRQLAERFTTKHMGLGRVRWAALYKRVRRRDVVRLVKGFRTLVRSLT